MAEESLAPFQVVQLPSGKISIKNLLTGEYFFDEPRTRVAMAAFRKKCARLNSEWALTKMGL